MKLNEAISKRQSESISLVESALSCGKFLRDIQNALSIPQKIVHKTLSILEKKTNELHWPQLRNAVLDLTICCLQMS